MTDLRQVKVSRDINAMSRDSIKRLSAWSPTHFNTVIRLFETSLYHLVDGNPNTVFQFGTTNAGNKRVDYTPPAGDSLTIHSVVIRQVEGVDYTNTCVRIDDEEICGDCEYGFCESSWQNYLPTVPLSPTTADASPFITFLFRRVLEIMKIRIEALNLAVKLQFSQK